MIDRIEEKIDSMCNKISYNTGVGSFARDIVSSVAIELVKEEDDFFSRMDIRLVDKATGEDLDIACKDKNFTRLQPVKATGKVKIIGVNGTMVKAGYRVLKDNIEYIITENKIIENIYVLCDIECTQAGTIGNCEIGQINKFADNYPGLSKVENLEIINNGKDLESDEEFRKRVLNHIQKPRMSWNRYVFEDKALEVEGVELSHCIPRFAGAGTVKVVITEKDKDTVSAELLQKVKNHIEDELLSDITLEVEGIVSNDVNIVVTCDLTSDYNNERAKELLEIKINEFFFNNIFSKKINYFDLVKIVQECSCIYRLQDLTINNSREDLILNENKLCKIGVLTVKGV